MQTTDKNAVRAGSHMPPKHIPAVTVIGPLPRPWSVRQAGRVGHRVSVPMYFYIIRLCSEVFKVGFDQSRGQPNNSLMGAVERRPAPSNLDSFVMTLLFVGGFSLHAIFSIKDHDCNLVALLSPSLLHDTLWPTGC